MKTCRVTGLCITSILGLRINHLLTYSVALVRKRTIPTERPPLVGELVPTSADSGYHVVSVTDPYGRILGFLERALITITVHSRI
jgi:hypothetical protein